MKTFFNPLLSGYAGNCPPETVSRFEGDPGTKRNTWQGEDGWLGIDEWRTTKLGDGSNGTTSIYYRGDLVWEMQYGGSYPDKAIPFLREALMSNYTMRIWLGGRGPSVFSNGSLRYTNEVVGVNNFYDFQGSERIQEYTDDGMTLVGEHDYRGGFLFVP